MPPRRVLSPGARGSIEPWDNAYAKNLRSADAALNYARRQGKYEEPKLLGARHASAEAGTANVDYVKRMVQLEPEPLPAVPAVLKALESSNAAGPERAFGPGADVAAASNWVTRVAQVKARRWMAANSVGAGGFPQRRQGEQQGRQEPKARR